MRETLVVSDVQGRAPELREAQSAHAGRLIDQDGHRSVWRGEGRQ